MGVPDEPFEEVITECRKIRDVTSDAELTAADWQAVGEHFKDIFRATTASIFPRTLTSSSVWPRKP